MLVSIFYTYRHVCRACPVTMSCIFMSCIFSMMSVDTLNSLHCFFHIAVAKPSLVLMRLSRER